MSRSDLAPLATRTAPVAVPASPDRLPHLPGLDGLRAIAVGAVLLYHAGVAAVPGGFLGVEVFFVISGYLITGLLLGDWALLDRIRLRRFWFRRARRLLPALFALLVVVLAFAALWMPESLTRLRSDAAAAATYVTNWYVVLGQQSYFETSDRQSPLLHLWSLAVEEQFYIAWPIVLALALRYLRPRLTFALTVGVAVASAAWMAVQFQPDADPSRLYYGTDTRLTGLLLGAALAFVWLPGREPGSVSRPPRSVRVAIRSLEAAGIIGVMAFFLALEGTDPRLYRGGFLLLDLATVALIAGVVHPASALSPLVLERRLVRWVGTRSYSIYLWHWPIFSITRPGVDLAMGDLAAFALRIALTVVLAEASYRFVETPIRQGGLGRAWARWRDAPPRQRRALLAWQVPLVGALLLSVSGLAVVVATAAPPGRPAYLPVDAIDGVLIGDPSAGANGSAVSLPSPGASAKPSTRPPKTSPRAAATAPVTPMPWDGRTILAIGDSVLLDAAPTLAKTLGRVAVDAAVGRTVAGGVDRLEARLAAGDRPDAVVVVLGNNGVLLRAQFERAMRALRDVPIVVWVNVSVPRPWESDTNALIAALVPQYPNARLVDWHAASSGRPDLFYDDGYHPRGVGAKLYARLVLEALRP